MRNKPNLQRAKRDANCRPTRGLGEEYTHTAPEKTKPICRPVGPGLGSGTVEASPRRSPFRPPAVLRPDGTKQTQVRNRRGVASVDYSTIPAFQSGPIVRNKPNLPRVEIDANCWPGPGLGEKCACMAPQKNKANFPFGGTGLGGRHRGACPDLRPSDLRAFSGPTVRNKPNPDDGGSRPRMDHAKQTQFSGLQRRTCP